MLLDFGFLLFEMFVVWLYCMFMFVCCVLCVVCCVFFVRRGEMVEREIVIFVSSCVLLFCIGFMESLRLI